MNVRLHSTLCIYMLVILGGRLPAWEAGAVLGNANPIPLGSPAFDVWDILLIICQCGEIYQEFIGFSLLTRNPHSGAAFRASLIVSWTRSNSRCWNYWSLVIFVTGILWNRWLLVKPRGKRIFAAFET